MVRSIAILAVCAVLVATTARADDPPPAEPSGASKAQILFNQGVAAAEEGDYATACAKLQQSLELVTRASTLINLGLCEAKQGKLASALSHYKQGVALLPPNDPQLGNAAAEMEELNNRVPRLTLRLDKKAPSGAQVLLDGSEVARGMLDLIPLDPGAHEVLVSAPGRHDATVRVELAEGERKVLSIEAGAELPRPKEAEPKDDGAPLLLAGAVLAGVGVAGLAAGTVLGVLTLSYVDDAETDPTLCPDMACTPQGRETLDDATVTGHASTVAFAVGGAALAAGVVLLALGVINDNGDEVGLVPWSDAGLAVRGAF